jgi:polyisoprenoid-binding protein YceI
MKKIVFLLALSMVSFSFVLFESTDWTSDVAHSRLGFTIQHLGVADINGEFKKFEVKINTSNGEFEGSSIEMSADVSSINTGIDMRDNHLKTADFFDVEKFPKIAFKSTSVNKIKKAVFQVNGKLTMHGVTAPVTLTATHNGTVKTESGKNLAGFKLTGVVKRSDFGIGDATPVLSDEVKLQCDLELSEQ